MSIVLRNNGYYTNTGLWIAPSQKNNGCSNGYYTNTGLWIAPLQKNKLIFPTILYELFLVDKEMGNKYKNL